MRKRSYVNERNELSFFTIQYVCIVSLNCKSRGFIPLHIPMGWTFCSPVLYDTCNLTIMCIERKGFRSKKWTYLRFLIEIQSCYLEQLVTVVDLCKSHIRYSGLLVRWPGFIALAAMSVAESLSFRFCSNCSGWSNLVSFTRRGAVFAPLFCCQNFAYLKYQ